MKLRTLDGLDVAGKRVLLRADFNVPLSGGRILDDMRIRATIPTIAELLDGGARRVVCCSHLGRPKGSPNIAYSLEPVAVRLAELLGRPVAFIERPDEGIPEDGVALLENLRFDPGEETNAGPFAERLASSADVFVNDAFGAAHRAHASVVGVAGLLPAAAGRLLEREVSVLGALLECPQRPFVAVVGGAKVSDKLPVLERLSMLVDQIAIGGAMCFTFFLARGFSTGTSPAEPDRVDEVRTLLERAGEQILLPVDLIVAESMEPGIPTEVVAADAIPADRAGYDIGPQTCRAYVDAVRAAKTVFWNGPMGVFEIAEFESGTRAVAAAVAKGPAYSVVGGGDSGAALEKFGYAGEVDHLSTGGGASLEFLEGKTLPGLVPLME